MKSPREAGRRSRPAASAMHHGAASADRAAEIATVPWPHGPQRALRCSNTRRKTRIPPSDSFRRFRPCSPRTPRAHFATKKCNGARLRLNIGHQAAARTPHGVGTPLPHPGATVRSRHPPSRSLAAAPQRVAQRRSRRQSVTDGPPPSGFSRSCGGDCDCSLAARSAASAEMRKHPQNGPHTAVGLII